MAESRVPPHNLEAEQSLLGSLLIDREAIFKVADVVRPDDFYRDAHRRIFEAMIELTAKREPIDLVSVSNRLEERKDLAAVGGRGAVAALTNVVPTAGHVVHYAHIVQRKATLRRLSAAAGSISELAFHEGANVDEVLDQAEQQLFGVSQKYLQNNFVPLKQVLTEAFERIDDLHKQGGKLRGIPTGFADIDKLLAGLQASDLVVLAARPSMGKTSFALDIARHVATREKVPVGIFSLEMSKEQLVDRLLCAEGGVDLWKMRTGRLKDDEDFAAIGRAMGTLAEAQLFIDDSAMANVMELRSKARRLQAEHGLGLIVVDYLQLMEGRGDAENRVQQVAEITRALKGIARELSVPVLALSQLSRAVELERPPIPKLSHLRESGSIEQDADVVMFIYRPTMYLKEETPPEKRNLAEIHVAKHRNGPTGRVDLFFNENTVSFANLEKAAAAVPF